MMMENWKMLTVKLVRNVEIFLLIVIVIVIIFPLFFYRTTSGPKNQLRIWKQIGWLDGNMKAVGFHFREKRRAKKKVEKVD